MAEQGRPDIVTAAAPRERLVPDIVIVKPPRTGNAAKPHKNNHEIPQLERNRETGCTIARHRSDVWREIRELWRVNQRRKLL